MSVNRTTKSLTGVEKDIDNIQIGVREITEDQDEEEEDEDEMIKEIKGIEKRLIKLHEAIVEINKRNVK
jgi:peptidoglycan hydrolase CwlO-like protein